MRMPRWALGALIAALAGIWALWAAECWRPPRPPVPVGRVDTVPDTVFAPPETLPPTVLERIVRVPVVVDRSYSRGTPDTAAARRYARAVFRAESLEAVLRRVRASGGDTAAVERPRGVLPPVWGGYDGKALTLNLVQSTGRMMRATARVRPPWTFVAGRGGVTDTVPLVVGASGVAAALREVAGCSKPAAVMALAGALLVKDNRTAGAAGGAAGGLLSCLAD